MRLGTVPPNKEMLSGRQVLSDFGWSRWASVLFSPRPQPGLCQPNPALRNGRGPARPTSTGFAPVRSRMFAPSPPACGGKRPASATPAGPCSSTEERLRAGLEKATASLPDAFKKLRASPHLKVALTCARPCPPKMLSPGSRFSARSRTRKLRAERNCTREVGSDVLRSRRLHVSKFSDRYDCDIRICRVVLAARGNIR